MRYLITGAQGFVGRYLVARLRQEAAADILGIGRSPRMDASFTHSVTGPDGATPAPLPPFPAAAEEGRYEYRQLDILDSAGLRECVRSFRPDLVFHLASGLRDDDAQTLCRTNIEGVVALLEAVAVSGIKLEKLVIGSSGAVYGTSERLPLDEESPARPVDLYGATKLAGEIAARAIAGSARIPIVFARIFNIVGVGADERHAAARFASLLVAGEARGERFILETGDLTPSRDFIDASDVAAALALLGRSGRAGAVYNIASGLEVTISDLLGRLLRLSKAIAEIRSAPNRPADIPRHFAATGRMDALGFVPQVELDRSLGDMLTYYRALWFRESRG